MGFFGKLRKLFTCCVGKQRVLETFDAVAIDDSYATTEQKDDNVSSLNSLGSAPESAIVPTVMSGDNEDTSDREEGKDLPLTKIIESLVGRSPSVSSCSSTDMSIGEISDAALSDDETLTRDASDDEIQREISSPPLPQRPLYRILVLPRQEDEPNEGLIRYTVPVRIPSITNGVVSKFGRRPQTAMELRTVPEMTPVESVNRRFRPIATHYLLSSTEGRSHQELNAGAHVPARVERNANEESGDGPIS